jgi:hypothetical protein
MAQHDLADKLACEREARHDVMARGRRVDLAAALLHYLSATRIEEGRRHAARTEDRSEPAVRPARPSDEFAARHPLAASWLRWGEEPR